MFEVKNLCMIYDPDTDEKSAMELMMNLYKDSELDPLMTFISEKKLELSGENQNLSYNDQRKVKQMLRGIFISKIRNNKIDLSEEMLAIAQEKCEKDVLLLHQDMRELTLLEPVDAAICAGDGVNYLETLADFEKTVKRVHKYLKPGGVFIFDLKTDYYFREIVGNRTITDNRDDASYIWENSYDAEKMRNEYLLTVYELFDDEKDLFVRTDELHMQQVFPTEQVKEILERNRFSVEAIYEAFSEKEPSETSERLYVAARAL